jgi:hypothetical protein
MQWRLAAALALFLAILMCSHPPAARAAFACPVTIPNDSLPPPGGGSLGPASLSTHGNGLLWTILPDDGVWQVAESSMKPDGSIVTKFVWWRRVVERTVQTVNGVVTAETTFAGDLHISGRRLDAPSDPLTATTRPEGVHVGSSIVFSSGGCWEITGTAGEDSITFTVYMLPPGDPLPNTAVRDELPWTAWGLALLTTAACVLLRLDPARRRAT